MAECKICNQEMLEVKSCVLNRIEYPDGMVFDPVPYENEYRPEPHRCHDCGVEVGAYHHHGCDMERCPRCNGQLITCYCWDDSKKLEELADTQHRIWSHWMKYMFSCGAVDSQGNWIMPKEKVKRWTRQMDTEYENLTQKEKTSDRDMASWILATLERYEWQSKKDE